MRNLIKKLNKGEVTPSDFSRTEFVVTDPEGNVYGFEIKTSGPPEEWGVVEHPSSTKSINDVTGSTKMSRLSVQLGEGGLYDVLMYLNRRYRDHNTDEAFMELVTELHLDLFSGEDQRKGLSAQTESQEDIESRINRDRLSDLGQLIGDRGINATVPEEFITEQMEKQGKVRMTPEEQIDFALRRIADNRNWSEDKLNEVRNNRLKRRNSLGQRSLKSNKSLFTPTKITKPRVSVALPGISSWRDEMEDMEPLTGGSPPEGQHDPGEVVHYDPLSKMPGGSDQSGERNDIEDLSYHFLEQEMQNPDQEWLDELNNKIEQLHRDGVVKETSEQIRKPSGGGISYATLGDTDQWASHEIRKLFEQHLVGRGNDEEVPVIHPAKFVKRYLSHQNLNIEVFKKDAGLRSVLIIADVSGSCYRYAKPTSTVATTAGLNTIQGSHVVVISCHNILHLEEMMIDGMPYDIPQFFGMEEIRSTDSFHRVKGKYLSKPKTASEDEEFQWTHEVRVNYIMDKLEEFIGQEIEICIGIGDSDEFATYQAFARRSTVEKVLWIDNYMYDSAKPDPFITGELNRGHYKHFTPEIAHQKLVKVDGAGDVRSMVKAMKMGLIHNH